MFRFFIFSLLTHGLLYFLIQLSLAPATLDDPIVIVSYVEPSKSQSPLSQRKSADKTNNDTNKNEMAVPEQPQQVSDKSFSHGQALESQNVSEKPRVLYQEKAAYPVMAKEARIEGPVKLSVTIDKLGRVIEVVVLEGPGYGLNETAVAAMKNFKFSPAQKEGQSVAVRITYIYRFKLESR